MGNKRHAGVWEILKGDKYGKYRETSESSTHLIPHEEATIHSPLLGIGSTSPRSLPTTEKLGRLKPRQK